MPVVCDGCLGRGRCGVCLGFGVIDIAKNAVAPCHRCYGTGKCWMCQDLSVEDLGRPPELDPDAD